jgi:NitT/TauT family transport system ATP-binding protein
MIQLDQVDLAYNNIDAVLRGIELSIAEGQFVSLLGPSGCGKSTMLRLIAGLLAPSSGKVLVDGQSAEAHRKSQGDLAFVFQDPRLLPWRDVKQNIGLPLELKGVDRQVREEAVVNSMRLVELAEQDASKRPSMLSGGMRMRVSIARALVTTPKILLLDEPFAALDDLLREQLNETLLRIWKRRNTTTVFVTHNVAEAVFLSGRVVVLGGQPCGIQQVVEIPSDVERDRGWKRSGQFAELCGMVSDVMRGAAAE